MENIKDILDYISSWSALKWIIIVLIAGFIGQFGKMLASAIVKKIKLMRQKYQGSIKESLPAEDHELPPADIQKDARNEPGFKEAYPDKKALKIMAKAKKKAAKKNK
ncbi:MAG: hypothetical protein ABFD50_10885 [Smithella sp.]